MIHYFIGLEIKDRQEFVDWAIIEEKKGFICPLTDKVKYECKGCNPFPKGERIPGRGYAYYTGMVETYCPAEHLESEFVWVGVKRSLSVKGIISLIKKLEEDLYKLNRKIGLYIGVEGIGLSVLAEKLPRELEYTRVIPVFIEGSEKIDKNELIGHAIALQETIKVSSQVKNDPVYLELEKQRRSLRVSSFTLACWGIKLARGRRAIRSGAYV